MSATLEINDFSGGKTDYPMLGGPTRFQEGDNFCVNPDKRLEEREGSVLLDDTNYILPDSPRRVDTLFTYNFGSELMAHSGTDVLFLDPDWTPLTGPDGAAAIQGGETGQYLHRSEYKGHLYMVGSGRGRPSKLYRDEDGELQVRSVGLPEVKGGVQDTDDVLIAKCLALANDLRRSMVNHMADTTLHSAADTVGAAFFNAAPEATDEDSLYTLVEALGLAYESHGHDASDGVFHNAYTISVAGYTVTPVKGPFRLLDTTDAPASLEEAAAQLDQIRDQWEWHRLGIFTHDSDNTLATIDKHVLIEPKIGTIHADGYPIVTPDFTDFINYVNQLKTVYNAHLADAAHTQDQASSNYQTITLDDAASLEDAILLLYWIRASYAWLHVADARAVASNTFLVTFDTASPALSSITDLKPPGGATFAFSGNIPLVGATNIFTLTSPDTKQRAAIATSTGVGTATLSKTVIGTAADQAAQMTSSYYHCYFDEDGNLANAPVTYELPDDEVIELSLDDGAFIGDLPTSVAGWLSWAQEIWAALTTHVYNQSLHMPEGQFFVSAMVDPDIPFYVPEIASYSYAFIYSHSYQTEEGTEFEVFSAPVFVGPIETCAPQPARSKGDHGIPLDFTVLYEAIDQTSENSVEDGFFSYSQLAVQEPSSIEITQIPRLQNAANTNYDTETVKVRVYRTTSGGTTYYQADELDNGTLAYSDTINDTESQGDKTALNLQSPLYTTGGVVSYDQAPECACLHVIEEEATSYYGDVTDGIQRLKGRVIQSSPGVVDSGPATFFVDIADQIIRISSHLGVPVAFGRYNGIYRLENGFTETGAGALKAKRISRAALVSPAAVVETEVGLFYAALDGFYYTDGYQAIKVSIDLDKSYKQFTRTEQQCSRITGAYDPKRRIVFWAIQEPTLGQDVNKLYVLHLNYGIKPSGCFTTWSNGDNFRPSALTMFEGDLIRGDARGAVFRHTADSKTDPEVPSDVTTAAADWETVHIPYKYLSCHLAPGGLAKGQRAQKIHLVGENQGNALIRINAIKENNSYKKKPLAAIRYTPNPTWGQPNPVWADPSEDYPWRYEGKLDVWRRFPSGAIRAQMRQIEIVPAYAGVYRSDDFPFGFVCDVSATQAVLITPDEYLDAPDFEVVNWPTDVVGMFIAFDIDDYQTEYEITDLSGAGGALDVITFDNGGNAPATTSGAKWVIRGIMKEQRVEISSYVIHLVEVGERGADYEGKVGRGENAE